VIHEQQVFFSGGDVSLEGLYSGLPGALGAVISHPHPLMGGNMRDTVVEILADAFFAGGISTFRFNFRGVGMSEGSFDEGQGEQEDVLTAISYLEEQGAQEIIPAGYSFGAWVNAGVIVRRNLLPAVFVSPPINLFPFDFKLLRGKIGLILCGDRDPFCPLDRARDGAAQMSSHLEIIAGADHFFQGRTKELAVRIDAFVKQLRQQKK
jgi:uncharacterized protein